MASKKGAEVEDEPQAALHYTYTQTQPGVPASAHVVLESEYETEGFLTGQSKTVQEDRVCRDLPFLIAFLLHLAGVLVIVGVGHSTTTACEHRSQLLFACSTSSSPLSELLPLLQFVAIVASIAIGISTIYLQLLKAFTAVMIYLGMSVLILSIAAAAAYLGYLGSIYGAVVFGISGLFWLFYLIAIRSRIPFAVEILRTAATLVQAYPATQLTAYLSILVKIAWVSLWAYAAFLAQRLPALHNYAASAFLLFSFYWTFEVMKNVVHVTVSGVVATWYFMTHNMPANPTAASFKRATTTSLGSIAFGSLIVAIIKTLRTLLRAFASKNSRNVVALMLSCVALCFLGCLDRLAQYFNHYAFCLVAIYGKTYLEAAKETWSLFKHAGLEAIVNDNIIDGVLWVAVLVGSLVTGLAGFLVASLWPSWTAAVGLSAYYGLGLGLVVGLVMMVLCVQVLDSTVACLFVCFASDKETLRANNPGLHQRLMETYYNVDV